MRIKRVSMVSCDQYTSAGAVWGDGLRTIVEGQRDPFAELRLELEQEAAWRALRRFARIEGGVLIEIVIANGFAFFNAFVRESANAWVSWATGSGDVGLP